MSEWMTVSQVAKKIGRSVSWIHKLIQKSDSRLDVQMVGSYYLISRASANKFRHRKPGNPGKKAGTRRAKSPNGSRQAT